MRRYFRAGLFFVFIMGMLGLANKVQAAYKTFSLDGDWEFTFTKGMTVDTPKLPDESDYDTTLRVPDYMNFQTDRLNKAKWGKSNWKNTNFVSLSGTAFYRKIINIPQDWQGKSILLHVGRAYDRINVWVNGKHVVFWPYISFIPLTADLSGMLHPGKSNEIIISVDNKTKLTKKFAELGGIVSPVYLEASNGPGRIDSLYLKPGKDLKEIVWQTDLKIPSNEESLKASQLDWIIRDWKSGREISKGSVEAKGFSDAETVKWTSKAKDIKPWSPNHPNLYVAELAWKLNDKTIDTLKQRFGLRRWSTEGRSLKLNGKLIYLRQVLQDPEHATHWRYPQNKDYWLKYFQKIKKRGYNAVDWENIGSPEAFEAADEAGIVIQNGYLADAREYLKNVLKVKYYKDGPFKAPFLWADIARWTRIYPSMSIYVLGGEIDYYDDFIDDVARCNNAIKAVNPESLLLPNHAMRGIEYCFVPEDRAHLKNGVYSERLEKITKCSDIFGQYPGGVFSYHPLDGAWQDINPRFAVYKHPLISHEVMQSIRMLYPAFPSDGQISTLRYGKKGMEDVIYRWGRWPSSKARIAKLFSSGYAGKKHNLLYENLSHLAAILFKYCGEKIRKCSNVTGYQDICAHGGLNFFLEDSPGFTAEGFRRFNNDNVLLLDWDKGMCLKRCWWAGEAFEAVPMVSLYGEKGIKDGKLTWTLKNGDKVLFQGSAPIKDARLGKVSSFKPIKFNWPVLSENSKLNLAMELSGNGENVKNDWNFWVFKKHPAPKINAAASHNMYLLLKKRYRSLRYLNAENENEKLWIVDMLNEKAVRHLEEGGDVLLIGGKPFVLFTRWPRFQQGYRNHHNNGTIVYKHPVWKNIPNEGWGDWQFYPLLEGAPTVIFRNDRTKGYSSEAMLDPKQYLMKEVPFVPILEILQVNRQADQASIFELKAGKGRLFVSTCAIDMKNPVGVTFMDSVLEYVSGPDFKPEKEVKPEVLRAFLAGGGPKFSGNKLSFNLRELIGGEMWPQYKSFSIAPKDMVGVSLAQKTELSFNLEESQIPKTREKYIVLSLQGQDSDKPETTVQVEITLNGHQVFRGVNQWVKMGWSEWNIPLPRKWLHTGANKLEFRNLEKSGKYKFFGISGIAVKADDKYVRERLAKGKNIASDHTPPVMRFVSTPPIEKFGHQYIGTRNTVIEIKAEDKGSGVKSVEMSIDNQPYIVCTGPFILGTGERDAKKTGTRTLRFRCTDHAGNQTDILTGASEEGRDLDKMNLQIK
ncbi:MAG: sugar-binding domain-containing protein [Victivallaceae bacterium]